MIIAIDGYEANIQSRVGIGRYAYEILKQMSQKGTKEMVFRIYLPSKPLPDMPKETEWWQYRVIPIPRLWTFIGLPMGIAFDTPRPDVIFSPTHYIPRFISIPKVISIMDLSYLEYPDMFRTKDLYQLTNWSAYSIAHAARILTISQFSKDAIIEKYHVRHDRVSLVYPGFSVKKSMTSSSEVLKKYHLDGPYILSVGTIQPRKNFERLIEAFARLADPGVQLVIVGKKGWLWEGIYSAPGRFNVAKRVRFLDFVPDEDLPSLYTNARCFALPSLYEGFGLPVLEAMAYKCPVVVSNISSLPEIAGDAGIYVDPESTESISHGLEQAMKERTSAKGKERIKKGIDRLKIFSWEKAANQTLEVLEHVGKGL